MQQTQNKFEIINREGLYSIKGNNTDYGPYNYLFNKNNLFFNVDTLKRGSYNFPNKSGFNNNTEIFLSLEYIYLGISKRTNLAGNNQTILDIININTNSKIRLYIDEVSLIYNAKENNKDILIINYSLNGIWKTQEIDLETMSVIKEIEEQLSAFFYIIYNNSTKKFYKLSLEKNSDYKGNLIIDGYFYIDYEIIELNNFCISSYEYKNSKTLSIFKKENQIQNYQIEINKKQYKIANNQENTNISNTNSNIDKINLLNSFYIHENYNQKNTLILNDGDFETYIIDKNIGILGHNLIKTLLSKYNIINGEVVWNFIMFLIIFIMLKLLFTSKNNIIYLLGNINNIYDIIFILIVTLPVIALITGLIINIKKIYKDFIEKNKLIDFNKNTFNENEIEILKKIYLESNISNKKFLKLLKIYNGKEADYVNFGKYETNLKPKQKEYILKNNYITIKIFN